MIYIVLSVILAALAVTGGVFSIASQLHRDSFLYRYSRAGRALFATGVCVFSIIAGWLAINEARARLRAESSDGHPQRVAPLARGASEGRSTAVVSPTRVNPDRTPTPASVMPPSPPRQNITKKTTASRIRIQYESGTLVPELILIAQRELPTDLMIEGTLHLNTTPPDDALQGLITANARLTVTTKRGEHLIDGFDLETHGGGFTAEASIREARERLEAEFTKRLKEHS